MGKMNAKQNNIKDNSKQGYFVYPDGKVFWGINVRRNGVLGIEVEKGFEGSMEEVKEMFEQREAENPSTE